MKLPVQKTLSVKQLKGMTLWQQQAP